MEGPKTEILKSLYSSSPQSIAEVSDDIGRSIPSITKTINELLQENLIINEGPRASTGGRRAKSYRLNKDKLGYIISVAIDQYHVEATAYDINNKQVTDIYTIDISHTNDKDVYMYSNIEQMISELISTLQTNNILAIGVTTPGFVDSNLGVNNSYKNTSPLYDIREKINKKFNIPTYIENDSSAIAITEKYFGDIQNRKNALIVNLNWGVGLGMIVENKLFRGHNGFAGEFSHIPLADHTKLCSCGKKGCLEVEASLRSAIEYVINKLESGEASILSSIYQANKNIKFSDLVETYQLGDQLTIKAIKKIAHMLGKGISTLIHILNPEVIVISGKGAVFGNILISEIQSSIQEYCIPRLAQHTKIEVSKISNVQLISSACIAVQQTKWD